MVFLPELDNKIHRLRLRTVTLLLVSYSLDKAVASLLFRLIYRIHQKYKNNTVELLKSELTQQEKDHNKSVGAERIFVEHAIGEMKRYRILEHRNRLKSSLTINQVIGVCAAIWNLHLITV